MLAQSKPRIRACRDQLRFGDSPRYFQPNAGPKIFRLRGLSQNPVGIRRLSREFRLYRRVSSSIVILSESFAERGSDYFVCGRRRKPIKLPNSSMTPTAPTPLDCINSRAEDIAAEARTKSELFTARMTSRALRARHCSRGTFF